MSDVATILADLNVDTTTPTTPLFADVNQQGIYGALSALGNSTLDGDANLMSQAVRDIDETIQKSIVAAPHNMMLAFRRDFFSTPLNAMISERLTADSEQIMFDGKIWNNAYENTSETQVFFTPFGGYLGSSDLDGSLYGAAVGVTHIDDDYIVQGHFAYGRGKTSQDLTTTSTDLTGNLFQIGGFTRLFGLGLETDVNLNFMLGLFDADTAFAIDSNLNSSANFNSYLGNLGVSVGKRFGDMMSVKPFIGLQGYWEKQDDYEFNALGIRGEGYNTAALDGLIGVEGRAVFENGNFLFAKVNYETKFLNSRDSLFLRTNSGSTLKYENETYNNIIGANIGARFLIIDQWKFDIEGIYKHFDSGLNYVGGQIGIRRSF